MTDSASDLLTVDDVCARYHLRDARAARRLMRDAGAFQISPSTRLLIKRSRLMAWEEAREAAAGGQPSKPSVGTQPRKRRIMRGKSSRVRGDDLPPNFFSRTSMTE